MGPGLRAPLPTGFKVFDVGRSKRERDSPTLPNPSQNLTLHDVPELTSEPQVISGRRKRARIGNAVVALIAEDPLPEPVSLSKEVESRVNVGSSSNRLLDKHSDDDSSSELGGSVGRPVPKPAYIATNYGLKRGRDPGVVLRRWPERMGKTNPLGKGKPFTLEEPTVTDLPCKDLNNSKMFAAASTLTSISLEDESGSRDGVDSSARLKAEGLWVDTDGVDPDPMLQNDTRVTNAPLLSTAVHKVEGRGTN